VKDHSCLTPASDGVGTSVCKINQSPELSLGTGTVRSNDKAGWPAAITNNTFTGAAAQQMPSALSLLMFSIKSNQAESVVHAALRVRMQHCAGATLKSMGRCLPHFIQQMRLCDTLVKTADQVLLRARFTFKK
jgi:hypothetical protein